jgi:hypothetical protein
MVIIFIILLSSIAAKTQRVGAESSVSQRELLNSLKALRRSVEEDIDCSQIDEVINHVAYQMPHTSKLDGIELRKIFKVLSNISLDTSTRVMEANKLRHLS